MAAGAAVVALVAAGCSEGGGAGGDGDGGSSSIKVVMPSYSDATQGFWKKQVKAFEDQNPNITVKLQVVDWNSLLQQVPTWTQTHTLPDVLGYNAYSKFAAEGLLRPAKQVTTSDVRGDIEPNLLDNGKLKGTSYALPFIASVRSLGYNKEIFKEIDAKPPTTWSDFEDVAKKAKKAGYTGYCLPLGSEEAQGEWSLWSWSAGGGWKQNGKWAINSQQNVDALKFLQKLANKDKVTEAHPGKVNRTDGCWKAFAQGDVAMTAIMPMGTFEKGSMKGSDVKWDSAPFPRKNASTPQFTLGVTDFVMAFKHPGNKEAVKSFMSFIYQKDRYVKFIKNEGFLPTTTSGSKTMADDPIAGTGIDLLPKAKFYPATDPAWNQVQKAVQSRLGTAMQSGKSAKKVLDSLQQVAEQNSKG